MPPLPLVGRILWIATFAGGVLLIIRLYWLGSHKTYPFFFGYWLLSTLQTAILLPIDNRTRAYLWVWIFTEPLMWAFYILIVFELCTLVLRSYTGIYTLGRWVLYSALSISVMVTALSLTPAVSGSSERSPILIYFVTIERGIVFSLVLYLLLMVAFMTYYPIPINRNTLIYFVVYSVFFLSKTVVLLLREALGLLSSQTFSTVLLGIYTACVLAWLFLLDRDGVATVSVFRYRWGAPEEKRLVEQLDELNSTLLRSGRR